MGSKPERAASFSRMGLPDFHGKFHSVFSGRRIKTHVADIFHLGSVIRSIRAGTGRSSLFLVYFPEAFGFRKDLHGSRTAAFSIYKSIQIDAAEKGAGLLT